VNAPAPKVITTATVRNCTLLSAGGAD